MAKPKNITANDILTYYMDYVVEIGMKPISVSEFSEFNNFEEDVFYQYFESFNTLEKIIFKTLFDNSIEVLKSSDEFLLFDTKNKLISLYFTFFENLSLNRNYVSFVLNGFENQLKALGIFSDLKISFLSFISEMELDTFILKVDGLENIQKKTIKEAAWFQLLIILKFWLSDTSESFEKTDIFIEKSVNTSFELLDNTFLKSVLDLGKFLYKEKIQSR